MAIRIHPQRFVTIFSALFGAQIVSVAVFLVTRPPLDDSAWHFLERQRPHISYTPNGVETEFFAVADGRKFSLARRAVAGWESPGLRLFFFVNAPAYLAASVTFQTLQAGPGGTSRAHSDVASAVFAATALVQWLTVSLLFSITFIRLKTLEHV